MSEKPSTIRAGNPPVSVTSNASTDESLSLPGIHKPTVTLRERLQWMKPTRRDVVVGGVLFAVGCLFRGCYDESQRTAAEQRQREAEELRRFQGADIHIDLLDRQAGDEVRNNNPAWRDPAERLRALQELRNRLDRVERNVRELKGNGRLLERINRIKFNLDMAINAAEHPGQRR